MLLCVNNTLPVKDKDNNTDAYNRSQRGALHQRLLVQLHTHTRALLNLQREMKKRNIDTLYMCYIPHFIFFLSLSLSGIQSDVTLKKKKCCWAGKSGQFSFFHLEA